MILQIDMNYIDKYLDLHSNYFGVACICFGAFNIFFAYRWIKKGKPWVVNGKPVVFSGFLFGIFTIFMGIYALLQYYHLT
ncbi:MAG TPA: hypothetical protein VNG53_10510 [Bacteroidia bacterium]|nr:hypothetical protein [Bacteroidia bacterium]